MILGDDCSREVTGSEVEVVIPETRMVVIPGERRTPVRLSRRQSTIP